MEAVHISILMILTWGAPIWLLLAAIGSVRKGLSSSRIVLSGLFMVLFSLILWLLWQPESLIKDAPLWYSRIAGYFLAYGAFMGAMEAASPWFIDFIQKSSISNPLGKD